MRGRISPKVMAKMIRNAVAPFAAVLVGRAADALGPIETNSTKPAAALCRKKQGKLCRYQGGRDGELGLGRIAGRRVSKERFSYGIKLLRRTVLRDA